MTTTWSSIRLSFTPITALPYKEESVSDSRILPRQSFTIGSPASIQSFLPPEYSRMFV